MNNHQRRVQKLPPSSADPVPSPLSGQPGEMRDEHLQPDQTEGDEGGGYPNLGNEERQRKGRKRR